MDEEGEKLPTYRSSYASVLGLGTGGRRKWEGAWDYSSKLLGDYLVRNFQKRSRSFVDRMGRRIVGTWVIRKAVVDKELEKGKG